MTGIILASMIIAMSEVITDVNAEIKRTENLSVSSEVFGGPMILEIIVDDPELKDTDKAQGMPDVIFNGHSLIMAQGEDGAWYAYVAHRENVEEFDRILEFGTECLPDTISPNIPDSADKIFCNKLDNALLADDINVLLNPPALGDYLNGQIGISSTDIWPFIQTFDDLSDDDTLDIVYNSEPPQTIKAVYDEDMDRLASHKLDKTIYSYGDLVGITINDNQLNIDPTYEDIWTFFTANNATHLPITYYGLFDATGMKPEYLKKPGNAHEAPIVSMLPSMQSHGFGDNGVLIINPSVDDNPALEFQFNEHNLDDSDRGTSGDDYAYSSMEIAGDKYIVFAKGQAFVTVEETGENSGVFVNIDSNDDSSLRTVEQGMGSPSFTIDYNNKTINASVNHFADFIEWINKIIKF